jgi:hypothetical protein
MRHGYIFYSRITLVKKTKNKHIEQKIKRVGSLKLRSAKRLRKNYLLSLWDGNGK